MTRNTNTNVTSAIDVRLTPRELAILALLAQGLTAAAIARRLSVSERTVHKHLEHAYAKLGVSDRLSAVLLARRHGLLDREDEHRGAAARLPPASKVVVRADVPR